MTDARELKFLNALNTIPGIGPATLRRLKGRFGSFEKIWKTPDHALEEGSVGEETYRAIIWKRSSISPDREMEKLVRDGISLVVEDDELYPLLLREIPQSPIALYIRGAPERLRDEVKLGVVGSRKPTQYGLEATESLVRDLTISNSTIVSGLALGIDARAHESTIDNGGKTIAVLGSGIDQNSIYPPEHKGLARRIVESGGLLISEYAPGTPALREHFPQRNRILSGLSRGVVIVEAREKSGALITARMALEQNRDVFAVPGSLFSHASFGPHKLIREGAILITSASDILEELGIPLMPQKKFAEENEASLDEPTNLVLTLLNEPATVDLIKEKSGLETPVIIATLSMLELKGLVRNMGQGAYQKT